MSRAAKIARISITLGRWMLKNPRVREPIKAVAYGLGVSPSWLRKLKKRIYGAAKAA